jgi:enolase
MAQVSSIKAREILDSRGQPTIEVTVVLDDNSVGISSAPAGTSIGKAEAVELRDQDPARFDGMGVLKAVAAVEQKISPALEGQEVSYQNKVDQILINLDGTPQKSNLGANTMIATSQAILKAAAASYKMPVYAYLWAKYQLADRNTPLPTPIFNLINGGKHGAANLDFQEFHIIPSSRFNFSLALKAGVEIYQALKKALIYRKAIHSVGDDGGFTPNLFTNLDALEVIREAINNTSYQFNTDIFLGLDVAANQIYKSGKYFIKDRAQAFAREEFISYYEELNKEYHLLILEDPLEEDDWTGWKNLTAVLGRKTVIVGDDLICTNLARAKQAIQTKACNGILVKPNQIGTVTETAQVLKLARDKNWQIIISQRGGETNDDFIADFAVGIGANYTKFGAPARGERVVKYNRLLSITQSLEASQT